MRAHRSNIGLYAATILGLAFVGWLEFFAGDGKSPHHWAYQLASAVYVIAAIIGIVWTTRRRGA